MSHHSSNPGRLSSKEVVISTPLQDHQRRAIRRALEGNLVFAHSTGSGKTLTAIATADALGKPATVLTPASLVENFRKEIAKHKSGGPPIEVHSLPTAALRNYQVPKGNTLIIDEAHALRNTDTARSSYVRAQADNAGRILALTGTPAYNNIQNWAPLINLLARDGKGMPAKTSDFNEKYLREEKVPVGFVRRMLGARPGSITRLREGDALGRDLARYVDVFDTDVEKPERVEQYVEVPMDPDQEKVYRAVEGSIPANLRYKLRSNLPPSKTESRMLNAFYGGARQVANTPRPFSTIHTEPGSKLKTAAGNLVEEYRKDPTSFRALVYSNYLDAGVRPYAELLDEAGIPYAIFDGSLSARQKKDTVDAYNKGRLPVILGTSSASEGLDLQGTSMIQVLEPHFNNSRLEQVIGRGIRYRSHSHLPPSRRKVIVQRYLSTLPQRQGLIGRILGRKPTPPTSIDQCLRNRSEEKDGLSMAVRESLEKVLAKYRNNQRSGERDETTREI